MSGWKNKKGGRGYELEDIEFDMALCGEMGR